MLSNNSVINVDAIQEVTIKGTKTNSVSKEESASNNEPDNELHFLSKSGLLLYVKPEEKPFPPVPPSTPKELIPDCYVTKLPILPDTLKNIKIPCVRESGIRDSIGQLAKHFNCESYRNNLVQFWFLDMLVDCLWRAQDEFKFSKQEQIVILEWILFVLKVISSNNMTKTLMFQILNEALSIAEDYVQSRGPKSPTPNTLFSLEINNIKDESEKGQYSFTSFFSDLSEKLPEEIAHKSSKQLIVIKLQDDIQIFKIPNNETVLEGSFSSSIDPPSENEIEIDEPTENMKEDNTDSEISLEFYKPDISTPPRFKSLEDLDNIGILDCETTTKPVEEDCSETVKEWLNVPRKEIVKECPSEIITKKIEIHKTSPPTQHNIELRVTNASVERRATTINVDRRDTADSLKDKDQDSVAEIHRHLQAANTEDLHKENIFKIYYDYNMWQLKNEYMADPNIGWTPSLTSYKNSFKINKLKEHFGETNALTISATKNKADLEKKIFINLGVLMAVKQIMFEYFNYNFSFELVKMSLKYPQYFITQDINASWNIPKEIKGEIKIPIPKKPKKEKVKKEKVKKEKVKKEKDKKDKRSRDKKDSSKKSKSVKDSKSKGKDKKKKDTQSRSEKKSKSSKKSAKKPKIGKEERKEMDRLKKEHEAINKQLFKEEENKRYMFPLKDAVDEEFFTKLFPDFKARKIRKKPDKSSKSSKSDKSSKKGRKGKGNKK